MLAKAEAHEAVEHPAGGTGRRPRPRPRELVAVALVVAVAGGWARWWVRDGAAPLRWNDSIQYLGSAAEPWLSLDRWVGLRPVLMPAALSLVGRRLTTFVTLQTIVAAASWSLLAVAVASKLAPGWRRWLAAAAVLGLSLVWPLSMWDQQVLSESLALSAVTVTAAALIEAAQGLDRRRAVALVAAVTVLLAARDSHVVPVVVGAAALAAWALLRRPPRRRLALLTAGCLLALAFLVSGSARIGHRDSQPIEHLYAARVLPYPDRLSWFAAHGMPDAAKLRELPNAGNPGQAPWVLVKHQPELAGWRSWLLDHGRSIFTRYVMSHPGYVVNEPRRHPERVFNSGRGIGTYRPHRVKVVPGLASVFWPSVPVVLALAAAAAALAWRRRTHRSPLAVAGAVLVVTAAPHAFVVWHSDAMESARHLLIPGLQLRVGALLLLLAATLTGTGRWRPARSSGRQPARPRPDA